MIVQNMEIICMECRMIRNKNGIWGLPVRFLHSIWEQNLKHGMCPGCEEKQERSGGA